jgi:hypothetical protein
LGTVRARGRGFAEAGALIAPEVRKVAERLGFSETRLLTAWHEIAGEAVATVTRPLRVSHGRDRMGATLYLACAPGRGPEITMQEPALRQRINAVYGYTAISRIRIDQAAPWQPPVVPVRPKPAAPDPALLATLESHLSAVGDDGLRAALRRLGEAVLGRGART